MNKVVGGKRSNFLQKIYRARKKGQDKKIAELIKNYVADTRNSENTDFVNQNNWSHVVEKEKKRRSLINDIVFYSGLVIIIVIVAVGVLFLLFRLNKGGVGALFRGRQTSTPTVPIVAPTSTIMPTVTPMATVTVTHTPTPTLIPTSQNFITGIEEIKPELLDEMKSGSMYWLLDVEDMELSPGLDDNKWNKFKDNYYKSCDQIAIWDLANKKVKWYMDQPFPDDGTYSIYLSDSRSESGGDFEFELNRNDNEVEFILAHFPNNAESEDWGFKDTWVKLGDFDFAKGDEISIEFVFDSCDANEFLSFQQMMIIKK